MDISASIVLYKTPADELKHIVDCLVRSHFISKIILVDNSPDNRLKDIILDGNVEYIFNNKNIGYGRGHNIAIRKVMDQSKFHLVLNSDISFQSDVIEKIRAYMLANPDVGQIMPRVNNFEGKIQALAKLLPTPLDMFIRGFIPLTWLQKSRQKFQLLLADDKQIMNVPYLSGCFMFFRTEALKNVGLFDERFFMHTEDTDITRRVHEQYKTLYYPKVSILHKHAKESQKNIRMLFVLIINTIRYFNKWGWVFDDKRKRINRAVLRELKML